MSPAEFESLSTTVLVVIFLLAAILGFSMRESRFCTMGAISDVVYLQDWMRMRQWAMAVGVAMCGATALVLWGGLAVGDTLYASSQLPWLSALMGGLLFGAGMVLASGCGARNLTRLGGGSLKALVVLLVMGLAAFATLKGITAVVRVRWLDSVQWQLGTLALLPELLARATGLPLFGARLGLGLGLGGLLILLALNPQKGADRSRSALLGGAVVGLCVTAAWWLGGHVAEIAEHPETLEHMYAATYSGRIEAFSFVTPVAHTLDWLLAQTARTVIVSAEQMVSPQAVDWSAGRCSAPGRRADWVVEAPYGAWPCGYAGRYRPDREGLDAFRRWAARPREEAAWLAGFTAPEDWYACLEKLGLDRLLAHTVNRRGE